MADTNHEKIKDVLKRGVAKIYPSEEALRAILSSGKKIRLYCGYDPSAPTLHLGHAITLRKLGQFQKLGHEVIMLIGDFTGMIGDPTDKSATRKKLTREEVLKNAKNYQALASTFLLFSGTNPAKIKYNSEWSDRTTFRELIELASNVTVQQLIERDMFQKRLEAGKPIHLHEFLYPLAQGYDSVAMDIDLEVGGSDQTFNMLMGRDLMRVLKNKEKFVLTMKLLTDPSGKKMGKSEGNMVQLDDTPNDMFGKIMSWPDGQIPAAFELLTDVTEKNLREIERALENQNKNPRDLKIRLAKEITTLYHGAAKADAAEKEFNRVFHKKELPSLIRSFSIKGKTSTLLDILVKTKLAASKSEAKRLIEQGAVKIDSEIQKDWRKTISLRRGMVLQAGKRKFAKISQN